MTLLAEFLAPGLAAAALVGVAAGLFRYGAARPRGSARADLVTAVVGLALLAGLHLSDRVGAPVVSGRIAFWADSALLHLAAYLVGTASGWLLARLLRRVRVRARSSGSPRSA